MTTVVTLPAGQQPQLSRPTKHRNEPATLSAFELAASTSYSSNSFAEEQWTPPMLVCGPRRRRRRALSFSSVTQAVHADARRRVRQQMMGWPVDLRRFLAGAFAGGGSAQPARALGPREQHYAGLAPVAVASDVCVVHAVSCTLPPPPQRSTHLYTQRHDTLLCRCRCRQQDGHGAHRERADADHDRQQGEAWPAIPLHCTASNARGAERGGLSGKGSACRRASGGSWRRHGRAAASLPSSAATKQVPPSPALGADTAERILRQAVAGLHAGA